MSIFPAVRDPNQLKASKESVTTYDALQKHLATEAAVRTEVRKAYEAAKPVSAEVAMLRVLGPMPGEHPSRLEDAEMELKLARNLPRSIWQKFNDTTEALRDRLERLSQELITSTFNRWQKEKENLAQQRNIEEVSMRRNVEGKKFYDIKHNLAALKEAQDRFEEGQGQLREWAHRPIPEIESFIEDFESELSKIDLTTMRREDEVPDQALRDLRGERPSLQSDSGILGPAGFVPVRNAEGKR